MSMKEKLLKVLLMSMKVNYSKILLGTLVIGILTTGRLSGMFQLFEWMAFDNFLRMRPAEPVDNRIVIIGINEDDIHRFKYPIPDQALAKLLITLQGYNPAAIGLDLVRDLPIEPGHQDLIKAFKIENLIGIKKVLLEPGDPENVIINPPPELPSKQVGFIDTLLDDDGNVRRYLLSEMQPGKEFNMSFAIRLAEKYLSTKGYSLENNSTDKWTMQFVSKNPDRSIELTRFRSHSGGYVSADDRGNQILLNFRSSPFRIISMNDIETGKVTRNDIEGRIILIGMKTHSAKDLVNAAAIANSNRGQVFGIEFQAHAISQIISAVLDDRPLIKGLPEFLVYVYIVILGIVGIYLGSLNKLPLQILLINIIVNIVLIGVGYGFILMGWWIPVVPSCSSLTLTTITLLFYRYEQYLKTQINERDQIIDEVYSMIHNGPLANTNLILSEFQVDTSSNHQLLAKLKELRQQLKEIRQRMRKELLDQGVSLYVQDLMISVVEEPLHEILYQVYLKTISLDFPCFTNIYMVPTFEQLDTSSLNDVQKKEICRFLEAALFNVGMHAQEANKLEVTCKQEQGINVIRIVDNGKGMDLSKSEGWGTAQAEKLAKSLGGKFSNYTNQTAHYTICELTWSSKKTNLWKLMGRFIKSN